MKTAVMLRACLAAPLGASAALWLESPLPHVTDYDFYAYVIGGAAAAVCLVTRRWSWRVRLERVAVH